MVYEGAEMGAVLQGDGMFSSVVIKQAERNTYLWVLGHGEVKVSCRAKTKRTGRRKMLVRAGASEKYIGAKGGR